MPDHQYGPLGELTQSTRYLQWSAGPGEQYTTKYTYDTWNRLQQLVYPDGEVLTYTYDASGQMHAVHGRKGSYDYPYVQRLDYDKFGQRTHVLHGNNTVSRYSYDPYNRRLSHLTVGKGDGNPFMDLSYGYDEVGNITDLANRASNNSPAQMGGATRYSYQYDDLYRLTDSSGTFDAPPGKQHRFTLSMGYDPIHNITHKTQVDVLRQPSGQEVTQKKTTYDWTYRYNGSQPHAPTHLGDRTFTYDASGNQLGWTHDQNGTRRTITWDDENRIREIKDNGHRLTYTYDAAGQRLTKRGPQGETGYINQWFTLRNGEVGTKHIYAGTTRVVSKLVKQDKPNSKRKGRIVYEKDQYTYHPDHLGTSAYITHTNGRVYQHLEYFPFGETWVEEHSNKQRTPYLFTAKELDEESQLYYFGARYYDPRTSVWQSPDPILNDYLPQAKNSQDQDLAGEGGVFNTKNLGLFTYSHNGPIIYFDPDGNERVEFSKVISNQSFNIVAYPVEDLSGGVANIEADIKFNPSGHQLSPIDYNGDTYYISSYMGGDNQSYINKVKEGAFSDLGDAATAATVACPACAVVTGPIALGAVAGEMAYSDNKMKTGILAIIGTVSGGAGRHAAEKLGPLSESFIKRAETSSSYIGEQAGDSIWNLLDQEQE